MRNNIMTTIRNYAAVLRLRAAIRQTERRTRQLDQGWNRYDKSEWA